MNKISYLFLVIAAVSCGGPKGNHFVIEGNIAGIRDSVEVVLLKMVAADTLIDGRFFFDIALEYLESEKPSEIWMKEFHTLIDFASIILTYFTDY